mmetsp:Transcript_2435/g.8175  ORF Transcript_2435/g.8175 Transcript_2435/m.8175 type:complete len:439 (-) Transcript_2435:160-1476(-)
MPEPDAPSGGVLPAIDGLVADVLPDKDKMYFNDYSTLVQQQGMLQDQVRTSIYQFAILENAADFRGKRVLDVGAGTGILSFFAARAGAARVFAVEASGMARHAEQLAAANGLAGEVSVLNQRVEDVELDERVDILISEPLGIALVNERMLESYLVARDRLLKPGGKMYPDQAVLYAAPFTDAALYAEQQQKLHFWAQTSFYGAARRSEGRPSRGRPAHAAPLASRRRPELAAGVGGTLLLLAARRRARRAALAARGAGGARVRLHGDDPRPAPKVRAAVQLRGDGHGAAPRLRPLVRLPLPGLAPAGPALDRAKRAAHTLVPGACAAQVADRRRRRPHGDRHDGLGGERCARLQCAHHGAQRKYGRRREQRAGDAVRAAPLPVLLSDVAVEPAPLWRRRHSAPSAAGGGAVRPPAGNPSPLQGEVSLPTSAGLRGGYT